MQIQTNIPVFSVVQARYMEHKTDLVTNLQNSVVKGVVDILSNDAKIDALRVSNNIDAFIGVSYDPRLKGGMLAEVVNNVVAAFQKQGWTISVGFGNVSSPHADTNQTISVHVVIQEFFK